MRDGYDKSLSGSLILPAGNMKQYLFYCFLIISALVPFSLNAQSTGVICKHYGIQNGLVASDIEYVYVDKEGYAWFASANGLQQFDGYNFTNYIYNADDPSSISYNFIASISEDNAGNIWIGTLGKGVNILNKKTGVFYHLYNESNQGNVLTSNIIPRSQSVFALDDDGYMWLNTDNGLNKINTLDFSVEHYFGDYAGDILFDHQEKVLWIASGVLKKFNPRTKKIDYFQINPGGISREVIVNSLLLDEEGLIWLGTNAGLFIFNKANKRFYGLHEYFGKKDGISNKDLDWSLQPVESVFIDYQGYLWIAIDKSIVKFDKHQGITQVYTHVVDNPGSLQNAKVSGIYGNDTRVLWVVYASSGVSRMNISLRAFRHFRSVPGTPNNLSANAVRSVFQDNKKNLWVGYYSDGLDRMVMSDPGKVFHYKCDPLNPNTINSNYVTSIFVDSKERLWVGTFDKGFCYADNINNLSHLFFKRFHYEQNLEVQSFTEDASGNIWVGTQWGFYLYDYASDQLIHYGDLQNQVPEMQEINIQSVLYEPPNTFWVATWNRGLCRLKVYSDRRLSDHVTKDSLVIYENNKDVNQSNIDNCFISIYKDGNVIWLGSNVNGLVKMIQYNDRVEFIKYDQLKGSPANSVYGIVKDKNGMIWVSTNHGLGKFNPENERFYNYYESDGLLSNSFVWNSYFQNQDDEVFFGGINGLVAFYPDQLTEEKIINRVYFSRLIVQNKEIKIGDKINGRQILNKNIQYTDSITLTYKETAFTIEFVALNSIDPEEVIFSYKLEGFDPDWITGSSQKRSVTYTNLRQGTYNFLVKASNNIADWDQDPVSLTIKILPPWWQTPVALTAFSMLFVALLLLFRWLILMRARLVHEARLEHIEREKTEELYQFKMRFFTDIAHEFRTPLSLVLAPLNAIVAKASNDPQLLKQSHFIRKNADKLLRLIEQIMDLRKIDLNKMKVHLGKGDIVSFVKELTSSFEEIALERSIDLEFKSSLDLYVTWFDENKLEEIIYNLLSNAFKFTPDNGRIEVSIGLKQITEETGRQTDKPDQYNEYVEIRIKDTGIGIPPERKDHLFERFFTIENRDSRVKRGTGIGLALIKELIDLQKGSIQVESEENKGTCFILLLPAVIDPSSSGEMVEILEEDRSTAKQFQQVELTDDHAYIFSYQDQKNEVYPDRKKPLILVVDDEPEVRTLIRDNLGLSYNICEAADGKTGFEKARRHNPEIIISDIIMPVMDGIEMCKKIKSDLRTGHIPVILLTARPSVENRIEGLAMGADAYIEKPFSMDLLESQVKNILETRKNLRNKFSKELIVKPTDITITSVDASFLQKAMDVVEKHISDFNFDSTGLSEEIGMSRSQLHRKLKGLTSQSASEFIRTLRLKRAASLLGQGHFPVEETSYRVGFKSPAYFTKCFKNHFGKTPSEYMAK